MSSRFWWILIFVFVLTPAQAFAQAEYRVYNSHPRIFLEPRRLNRLQKDSGRNTMRWVEFRRLLASGKPFPEAPLARALDFQATDNRISGKKAVAWTLEKANSPGGFSNPADLRLGAVVFDWCYELFSEEERETAASALGEAVELILQQAPYIGPVRSAVLASIAAAGDWEGSEPALAQLLGRDWPEHLLPALRGGEITSNPPDLLALMELSHVLRYNLEIDLWSEEPALFRKLPLALMLQYYPAPYESEEGIFHRRATPSGAALEDPVLDATLSRIAEMMMVAYENGWEELQYLQGWVRNEKFRLKTPLGSPYEFLWVNPYLPGLSYFSAPALVHDPYTGRVFAREGWAPEDLWAGYLDGELQIHSEGRLRVAQKLDDALVFPDGVLVWAEPPAEFEVELPPRQTVYVVGLADRGFYNVKLNRGDFERRQAERGGILPLEWPHEQDGKKKKKKRGNQEDRILEVRLRPAAAQAPSLRGPSLGR